MISSALLRSHETAVSVCVATPCGGHTQCMACCLHQEQWRPSQFRSTNIRRTYHSSRQAAVRSMVTSRVRAGFIAVSNFFLELADLRFQLLACHVDFHVFLDQCFVLLIQLLQCPAICFLRELPLFVDAISLLRKLVYLMF